MRKTAYRKAGQYPDESEYEDVEPEYEEPGYTYAEEQQPAGLFSTPGRAIALISSVLMLVLIIGTVVWLLASRGQGNGAVATGSLGTGSLGTAPKVGSLAPDFSLVDVQTQKPLKLSSLRGKPVFINFWGTWCPPCRGEMPEIEKTFASYKGQVEFLGISMGPRDEPAGVKQFVEQLGYHWTFIHDADYRVATDYQVQAIPMSYFIGKDGVIKAVQLGPMDGKQLQGYLAQIK